MYHVVCMQRITALRLSSRFAGLAASLAIITVLFGFYRDP